MDPKDKLDHRDPKDQVDQMVFKALKALEAMLERQVPLASRAHKAPLGSVGHPEHLERPEGEGLPVPLDRVVR